MSRPLKDGRETDGRDPERTLQEALALLPDEALVAEAFSVDADVGAGDPLQGEPPTALRSSRKRAGRKPNILKGLPTDDPLLLIEQLSETGRIEGGRRRMTTMQIDLLRKYCLLPSSVRTLVRLRREIAQELPEGDEPPTYDSLKSWARTFRWDALAREYDLNLSRWRLHARERAAREADERQAAVGRQLQQLSSLQIARLIREYNAPRQPILDPTTNKPLVNPRTGQPVLGPKPTMAGLQGLAVTYKIATETERVALGQPTMIASGRADGEGAEGDPRHDISITASVHLSLDDWRAQSRLDRERARGEQQELDLARLGTRTVDADSASHARSLRALPAPQQQLPVDLVESDLDQLPDDWVPDAPRAR